MSSKPPSTAFKPSSAPGRALRLPHPALRFGDAVVGVLKRHVLHRPALTRDPWLLDDLTGLLTVAARDAESASATKALSRMRAQLSTVTELRRSVPPPETATRPRVVAWMSQQRGWYATTVQSRARAGRRPAQLERLIEVAEFCRHAAERHPSLVEPDRLVRIEQFVDIVRAEHAAVLDRRAEMSPLDLENALVAESETHGRDAVLLDEHARESEEGRAAIRRWLDRAFELEAQWVSLASALPERAKHEHWRHMQRNTAALREALL